MDNNNLIFLYGRRLTFFLLVFIGLCSCASSSGSKAEETAESSNNAVSSDVVVVADSQEAGAVSVVVATVAEPAEIAPPRIVESCKDESYVKYEKQSRVSIKKGFDATKAEKYGVGFRDLKEHKRWSGIHKQLFNKVNEACGTLSQCAKQHPKKKAAKCAAQATVFNEWQAMAGRFSKKAKMVETTQPDKICSFKPNLNDAPQCFHALGDNVDKVCNSAACKEVSDCWRGIGFLDLAITQATTACGFVFKKLSDCRGYTEATSRRVKKFERCKNMQELLSIVRFPPL